MTASFFGSHTGMTPQIAALNMSKALLIITAVLTFPYIQGALPTYKIIPSPSPTSSQGNITRLAVESENLEGKVIVDIWTPAEYDPSTDKRYPVVYAHDGQNLFDASFSFAGVPWAIDNACRQLADDPDFEMPIIVGINNRGADGLRLNDYFPENALDYISPDQMENTYIYDTCKDLFLGNEEAAFVANELKPLVDSLYQTSPGFTTTFAMGSSMGALASMYLLCEYPEIFGGAACMSTHWIGSLNLNPDYTMNDDEVCAYAILQYLGEHIPSDGLHKLYMDQGTTDWDAGYLGYELIAREIVRDRGYTEENRKLYVYDAIGAGHNEWYWQQRVKIPLKFLLSKKGIDNSGKKDAVNDAGVAEREKYYYDLSGKKYSEADFEHLRKGIYIQDRRKSVKH